MLSRSDREIRADLDTTARCYAGADIIHLLAEDRRNDDAVRGTDRLEVRLSPASQLAKALQPRLGGAFGNAVTDGEDTCRGHDRKQRRPLQVNTSTLRAKAPEQTECACRLRTGRGQELDELRCLARPGMGVGNHLIAELDVGMYRFGVEEDIYRQQIRRA